MKGHRSRLFIFALLVGIGQVSHLHAQEGDAEASAGGANASDPTAAVNFNDIRYQTFDLYGDASDRERDQLSLEGAYVFSPEHKVTYELNYWDTDVTGSDESGLESLRGKYINLKPGMLSGGLKYRRALGVELIKDLGDVDDGIGGGTDQIAPLFGYGWLPNERNFVITLIQYFHSIDEDSGVDKVRKTGPRLIWIYKIPSIKGWFKLDNKFSIDHENDDKSSNTMELQVGTMLSPTIGLYFDYLTNNAGVRSYDDGYGINLRMMY